jgi:hypothetical protein
MDLINEFAFILSKNKPPEFDSIIPENSKIRKLYDLIIFNKVNTDDEASSIIYNSTKADKKYLMLKRNLVQKLADLVYLQDYKENDRDNYMNIHFQVEKELLIAEKLLLENVYHNPTKIIAKVEQTAKEYFFIDLQASAAKKLRSVYSLKGFSKETEEYNKKVKRLLRFQSYYDESKGMWEKLYSKTKYIISKSDEIIAECKLYIKTIEEYLKEYESPFIKLVYYRISILSDYQQDYQFRILTTLKKIDCLIKKYPFIRNKSLQLDLNYYYARFYRDVGQLDIAEQSILECLNLSDYRAFDKFLIQELNYDILVKQERYKLAGEIINEVHSVPQYQFLNNYDKSAWTIREAFLFFIYKSAQNNDLIQLLPVFSNEKSLHNFIEKTKKSTKDKNGYNLSLLIIRVVLYKIYDLQDIDNEGNNMLVYYHRYLKQFNNRTSVFFYQLAKSVIKFFDLEELHERRIKLIDKLDENGKSSYDSNEIIPYDKFWDLIVDLCKRSK